MKKPRVDRFDPKYIKPEEIDLSGVPAIAKHLAPKPKMRAPLIVDALDKEPETVTFVENKPYARPPVSTDGTPPARSVVNPSVRTPFRRTITRYAFEFFQDQIESLRNFSLQEKTQGEKGSMSEMVREAIDAYVAKRNRTG
jgi:hypothetical protein